MDEPRPAKRVYITVGGRRVLLIHDDKMLGPELRELKRICGMPAGPWKDALKDMDWDAWLAWIYVSDRRTNPGLTLEQLEYELKDTPVVEVLNSIEDETPEVAAPDNPLSTSPPSGSAETTNGGDSGGTSQEPSTTETSGQPT